MNLYLAPLCTERDAVFLTRINVSAKWNQGYPVLLRLSADIPEFGGVPTCYAAVRRGSKPTRLACVRRTASVHSELGSNSSKMDAAIAFASASLH